MYQLVPLNLTASRYITLVKPYRHKETLGAALLIKSYSQKNKAGKYFYFKKNLISD